MRNDSVRPTGKDGARSENKWLRTTALKYVPFPRETFRSNNCGRPNRDAYVLVVPGKAHLRQPVTVRSCIGLGRGCVNKRTRARTGCGGGGGGGGGGGERRRSGREKYTEIERGRGEECD